MNKDYWKRWAAFAGRRALKTVAQTAVSTIGVSAMTMGEVPWASVCSASVLAGIVSLLMSVAGLPELPDPDGEEAEDED